MTAPGRVAALALLLAFAPARAEVRIRGIFDIGSGATKLDLFEIDDAGPAPRLVQVLDDQLSLPVPLEAGKSPSGAIGSRSLEELSTALKTLRGRAVDLVRRARPGVKQIQFSAIATHAARTAANPAEFSKAVAGTGIPLRVLTQDEEGLAGYAGVRAKGAPTACRGRRLLVWDIGGGSMQFTLERPGRAPRQIGLPLGAEEYKQKLVDKLGVASPPRCGGPTLSPNPIGDAGSRKAAELADESARGLDAELAAAGDACVVGIGGVHLASVAAAVTRNFASLRACACDAGTTTGKPPACAPDPLGYSRRELECLAKDLAGRDDCDPAIKGAYSATNVSNLFLVAGFLRALGRDRVSVMNVNGGHGFVNDARLKFQTVTVGE